MLCGEIQKLEVTLKNIGNAPLTNIYIACTDAKLFTLENLHVDKSEGENVYSFHFCKNERDSLYRSTLYNYYILHIHVK